MLKVIFGLSFMLAGLAVILFFGKLTKLDCYRVTSTQAECKFVSTGLLGKRITLIPSGHLQGAKLEVSSDSDGDSYQVVLLTKSGKISFTDYYSSGLGTDHQKNVEKINAFVANSEQMSLNIRQDDRLFSYLFGGAFIAVGVISLFLPWD